MSKDETGCKLAPVYKHKERKPKKPHYIPRPWGKPYNYKCFQCPFTCMEKSHLYNHMKYSLCKNSLSLLIESDWPYKKGNLLHPELRLLQGSAEASRARGRRDDSEASDTGPGAAGATDLKPDVDGESGSDRPSGAEGLEKMSDEANLFPDEEEEEEEEDAPSGLLSEAGVGEKQEKSKGADSGGDSREANANTLLFRFKNKREKLCKEPVPDFIITDVFSLKKHVMKGKEPTPPEFEAKPKHCKGPKKCPGSGPVLMEQWKLVANGQRRGTGEIPTPCPNGNIIPCYPPPAYGEFHEPQSLNLSLLGINYPLSPNLFSYLGPSVANGATPQPHLAQLPFLASPAQLMHPHAAHFQPLQSPERSTFLPRLYYPLLFEHSFGSAENKMAADKPEAPQPPSAAVPLPSQAKTPQEAAKAGLLKVPVLKGGLPWAKGFHGDPPPEQGHMTSLRHEGDGKWLPHEKETNSLLNDLCKKPMADACQNMVGMKDGGPLFPNSLRKSEMPVVTCLDRGGATVSNLKRKFPGGSLDLLGSSMLAPRKVRYQASNLRAAPIQPSRPLDHWHMELHACTSEDKQKGSGSEILPPAIPDPDHPFLKLSKEQMITLQPRDPEATTVLIEDLSKTLEEYQEVEKKLSDLSKEDSPAQKQLRGQMVKIRQELFHIHEALEKATKSTEGPLDLSVKKSSKDLEKGYEDPKESKTGPKCGRIQGRDSEPINRCLAGREESQGDDTSDCLHENKNETIDLLIKMSRSENLRASCSEAHLGAVIKAEVLPLNVPLEFRHVMEPYYSRTTKCEADSSVLLSTDGRSNPGQGTPLTVPEDVPLGCRAIPCPLSCSLPCETEGACLHSPLSTDP